MQKAVLLNNTASYNHLGCYLTVLGLKKLLARCGIDVIYELEVNNTDFERLINVLKGDENTLLIINGEGTLHDDQAYAKALLELSEPFKTRTIILNSQLRNMGDRYISILQSMPLIQLRTMYDYSWCKNNGIKNITYCPDMLFYSGYKPLDNKKIQDNFIVYTDSHSEQETKRLVSIYLKDKRKNKIWVNMHYCYPGKGKPKLKIMLLKGLSKFFPKTFLWRLEAARERNISQILRIFESADSVITGRYHAACLAIQAKKPLFIAGSNTTKLRDLCNDFDWGEELNKFNIERDSSTKPANYKETELIKGRDLQLYINKLETTLKKTAKQISNK